MPSTALAQQLVATLPKGLPGLFNPWRDTCTEDLPDNGPDAKLIRLAEHLNRTPRFILCGEAPGLRASL